MYEWDNLEDWRTLAEQASREDDPARLLELAEKLARAIDQQLLARRTISTINPDIIARR